MARTKRKQANSAGQPTISIRAERTAQSLADERVRFLRRRLLMIGGPVLLVALLASGLLYACGSNAGTVTPVPTAASTSVVIAAPPATVPTSSQVAGAVQAPNPVLATAVAQPTTSAAASVGLTCPDIAGLPIYTNATCVEHESDQDNGVTKLENTYTSTVLADEVRRFYEGAFTQNGWMMVESKQDLEDSSWEYTVMQAQRRVEVKVDARDLDEGGGTKFSIAEK